MLSILYDFFGFEAPSPFGDYVLTGLTFVVIIYCFVIFFWFISCLLRRKV